MIQHDIEMDPDIPLKVLLFNSSGTSCIIDGVAQYSGSYFL